jgi:hypothetical protein
LGTLSWFDLLNRGKLSVWDDIYRFVDESSDEVCALPASVSSELIACMSLSVFWSVDLSRDYLGLLSATDASTEYGFGISVCPVPIEDVRKLSRKAEKRGDYVRLHTDPGDPVPKSRLGTPHLLNLKQGDFRTVLSLRAKHVAHISVLEAEAYVLWLKWLLRARNRHSKRVVCLNDSKSTLGSMAKGRTSAPGLRRAVRQAAALTMAGDLLVRLLYVPTEHNPADAPSRGARPRPFVRYPRSKCKNDKLEAKRSRFHQRLSREIERSPYREELNNLVSEDPLFWKFNKRPA